jgi:hypothetical protein
MHCGGVTEEMFPNEIEIGKIRISPADQNMPGSRNQKEQRSPLPRKEGKNP